MGDGLAVICLFMIIVFVAIVITIVIILLKEIARVFAARAFEPTTSARVLWITLAVFLGMLMLASLLMSSPATAAAGVYLVAWSFLGLVIVAEGVELHAQHHGGEAGELDSKVNYARAASPSNDKGAAATRS